MMKNKELEARLVSLFGDGQYVPCPNNSKVPITPAWNENKVALADIPEGSNIGLATYDFIVVDIDDNYEAFDLLSTVEVIRDNAPNRGALIYRLTDGNISSFTVRIDESAPKAEVIGLTKDRKFQHKLIHGECNGGKYVLKGESVCGLTKRDFVNKVLVPLIHTCEKLYGEIKIPGIDAIKDYSSPEIAKYFEKATVADKNQKQAAKPSFLDNMPSLPGEQKAPISLPDDTVVLARQTGNVIEIAQHFGLINDEHVLKESGSELKIDGCGGLTLNENDGTFFHHTENYGGDAIAAWVYFGSEFKTKFEFDNCDYEQSKLFAEATKALLRHYGIDVDSSYKVILASEEEQEILTAFLAGNFSDETAEYINMADVVTKHYRKMHKKFDEGKKAIKLSFKRINFDKKPSENAYLIDKLFERQAITLLHAGSGIGKTKFAISACTHIMTGQDFLSFKTFITNGKVLYLANEIQGDFEDNVIAELTHLVSTPEKARDIVNNFVFYDTGDVDLSRKENINCLIMEALYSNDYRLFDMVVIDTFRACTTGINENDNSQISDVLRNSRLFAETFDASVVIIHHDNKAGKSASGAGAFDTNCDIKLWLHRSDEVVNVQVEKNRKISSNRLPKFSFAIEKNQYGTYLKYAGEVKKENTQVKLGRREKENLELIVEHEKINENELKKLTEGDAQKNRKRTCETLEKKGLIEIQKEDEITYYIATEAGKAACGIEEL